MADPALTALARRLFGADSDAALALVGRYGGAPSHREPGRVRAAALELSGGDLSRLEQLVDVARVDYRDVLWWLEQERDRG